MRSKHKVLLCLLFISLAILLYFGVQRAADVGMQGGPSDIYQESSTILDALAEDKGSVIHDDPVEMYGSHSEEVSRSAQEFIEQYRKSHPGSYPAVSGQLDLLGNCWSCVMWDGEKSEVVLIFFDNKTHEIQQRNFVIGKELIGF